METKRMRGVTGRSLAVDTYLATIQIGSFTSSGLEVIAMTDETEVIIGRDVLNDLIVTLNGLAHIVEITQ